MTISGDPAILYDLENITDPSFEDGVHGSAPPSPWVTDADQVTDFCKVDNTVQYQPGSLNDAQLLSCRLYNGGGDPYLRQELPTAWMPEVGETVGIICAIYKGTVTGITQAIGIKAKLEELNGAVVNDSTEEYIAAPTSTLWQGMAVFHTITDSSSDRLRLVFHDAKSLVDWYIDYIHLGRACAFTEPPIEDIGVENIYPRHVSVGGGGYEAKRLGDGGSVVAVKFMDMHATHADFYPYRRFQGFVEGHRRFAFWQNRTLNTNDQNHYSHCIPPAKQKDRFPPGSYRLQSTLQFLAPIERGPRPLAGL
jgi:hypothetical protein